MLLETEYQKSHPNTYFHYENSLQFVYKSTNAKGEPYDTYDPTNIMMPLYNLDTGKPITTEDGGYITI